MCELNLYAEPWQKLSHTYAGDAGINFVLQTKLEIEPGRQVKADIGVTWAPKPPAGVGVYAQLMVRSSCAWMVGVDGGLIDSGYRGVWQIQIRNLTNQTIYLNAGCRYFQFVIQRYELTKLHSSRIERGTASSSVHPNQENISDLKDQMAKLLEEMESLKRKTPGDSQAESEETPELEIRKPKKLRLRY